MGKKISNENNIVRMRAKTAVMAFDALSIHSRLKIFRQLVKKGKKGLTTKELCEIMDMPPPTLSFHMSKLLNGDLVNSRKKGRFVTYYANIDQTQALINYLTDKFVDN